MSHRLAIISAIGLIALASGCSVAGSTVPATQSPPATQGAPTPPAATAAAVSNPPTEAPSGTASAGPAASAVGIAIPGTSRTLGPADFTATIDNPFFPLVPGTTFTYKGTKDGKHAIDVFKITDRTAIVDGVTCRLVDDRLFLDGVLAEKTTDYYTQDRAGNVWYFAEDTAELDANGKVLNRDGTWRSGVDGATPGIFISADPKVGDTFIQEFYAGQAEDHFAVIDTAASVTVPYGSFSDVLETKEWTPLEPDVLDHKYYLKGVGELKETAVNGPIETLELIKVERP